MLRRLRLAENFGGNKASEDAKFRTASASVVCSHDAVIGEEVRATLAV
jgi:hypothetical protein